MINISLRTNEKVRTNKSKRSKDIKTDGNNIRFENKHKV